MHIIEVGKPYSETRTTWPDGKVEYNFWQNEHELRFFFSAPTNEEINTIRKDKIEFGLFVLQPLIVLVYKFTSYKKGNPKVVIDGDAPYSIHLVPEEHRSLPIVPETENERVLLHIRLIDSDSGILKAQKAVSLSHEFSVGLTTAICEQSEIKFDETEYATKIKKLYSEYPDTDSMLKHSIYTCTGGD